jgi:hypothetical protein
MLKEKIEEKRKVMVIRGRGCEQLLHYLKNEKILRIERGNINSSSVNNLLWKRLWILRRADCGMIE